MAPVDWHCRIFTIFASGIEVLWIFYKRNICSLLKRIKPVEKAIDVIIVQPFSTHENGFFNGIMNLIYLLRI
jgi:hypothetical protein